MASVWPSSGGVTSVSQVWKVNAEVCVVSQEPGLLLPLQFLQCSVETLLSRVAPGAQDDMPVFQTSGRKKDGQ